MKNINISTEYILIYFAKLTNVEYVYKFGTQGHIMWYKLYFWRLRNKRKTYILQFHRTLLEDFLRGSFLT